MVTYPTLTYCGITLMLSNPSRFDVSAGYLLSGRARELCAKHLLPFSIQSCRICTMDEPLAPGTQVVVLMGEQAKNLHFDNSLTLNQLRGTQKEIQGITYIPTYLPQDSLDMKASYELNNNPWLVDWEEQQEGSDDDVKSTKGRTKRENFAFWLGRDLEKASRLLRIVTGKIIVPDRSAEYVVFPLMSTVLPHFYNPLNTEMHIDIENDSQRRITCLTISFNDEDRYFTLPLYSCYRGINNYEDIEIAQLLKGLAHAFSRMTIVVHNSMYDLFILAEYYHIPPPRKVYDTMLTHARIFPGTEKSLGHCMSLYTYMPYHKNEGVFEPHNHNQEYDLWAYNGKDVVGMKEVKRGQQDYLRRFKAQASVDQINASVYSYLCMTLHGVRIDHQTILENVAQNKRRMVQIQRLIDVLVGHHMLPTSNKATVNYFHNELKLKSTKRSKKTGKPSLDAEAFYQLYIKNENPVIPCCMEYRRLQKETSSLKFNVWRI